MLTRKKILLFLIVFIHCSLQGQTYLANFQEMGSFREMNDLTYFFGKTIENWGLYSSDGTAKGTYLIKAFEGSIQPSNLFVHQNMLYFAGADSENGQELWKSDGTTVGTVMIKDIFEGRHSSSPTNFTVYNGEVYFNARDIYINIDSRYLYKTDGTAEGTVLLDSIMPEGRGYIRGVANGYLYIDDLVQVHQTDGTPEGTTSVVIDGLNYMKGFTPTSKGLYFYTHDYNYKHIRLYLLTSTATDGFTMLKEFASSTTQELYAIKEAGDYVYFAVGSGSSYSSIKDALWRTDGTSDGTIELMSAGNSQLYESGNFRGFTEYNGKLYFNAGSGGNNAMWVTNGTKEGTSLQMDNVSLNKLSEVVELNGKIYFVGSNSYLYSYDLAEGTATRFSKQQNYARTTGDTYRVHSDGEKVYYQVSNDNGIYRIHLYNTNSNPLMEVGVNYSQIKQHLDEVSFSSKKDSLVKTRGWIRNVGNDPLIISRAYVSGEGFYINGKHDSNQNDYLSQVIDPGATGYFEIGFTASEAGPYNGHLILKTNTTIQSEFRLKLKGNISDDIPAGQSPYFPKEKEIYFDRQPGSIIIDNSTISESAPANTTVASLEVATPGEESFQFELTSGEGDKNNDLFTISGNQLVLLGDPAFNNQKGLTIRVRATGDGGTTEEAVFVFEVVASNKIPDLLACTVEGISLSSSLLDVEFLNETDAIAVGQSGVILKTTDKGITWQHLYSIDNFALLSGIYPYNSRLTDVQFVNEQTGFVTGESVLLRTDDGGLTWQPLNFELSYSTRISLTALSADHLILRNISPYYNDPNKGKLYQSTDGGVTWQAFGDLTHNYDPGPVYFFNNNFGLALNRSKAYHITNDGGEHWIQYTIEDIPGLDYDEYFSTFHFLDEQTGYATTTKGKFLKSTDGGITWEVINADYRASMNKMFFSDENTGYLYNNGLYKTSDGGLTWERIILGSCTGISSISLNNSGDIIAVGGGCYEEGRNIHYYSESESKWYASSYLKGRNNISYISYSSDQIFIFSENSAISNDGGNSWKPMNHPTDDRIRFAEKQGQSLFMKDSWGKLYKSANNGETWTEIFQGDSNGGFDALSEDTLFVQTVDGNIAKTTDGGTTWSNLSADPYSIFRNIEFTDDLTGYMSGTSSPFLRTVDGGATWDTLTMGSPEAFLLHQFHFVNSTTGMISSDTGFYKTNDGGDTWIKMDLPAKNSTTSLRIEAKNASEWYIAIGNQLYYSPDTGDTWTLYHQTSENISALAFQGDLIYLSQGNGAILKLKDDESTLTASAISGDITVTLGSEEVYTVIKYSDAQYSWEVEGENEVVYEGNLAKIKWLQEGTFSIAATPYNSCTSGNSSALTVRVFARPDPPVIQGPEHVTEEDSGIIYTTAIRENVKYIWHVSGHISYQANGNELFVDWGESGIGQVGLTLRYPDSGILTSSALDVTVLPKDPFIITTRDVSCQGKTNGQLTVSSKIPSTLMYNLELQSASGTESQSFYSGTTINDLAPGIYNLCITANLYNTSFCYQFEIKEPEPLQVSSKTESSSKKVSLDIQGGTLPYTISMNGVVVTETYRGKVDISASNGDLIEVSSAAECEFSYSMKVSFYRDAGIIPNPAQNQFRIYLDPDSDTGIQSMPVTIYNTAGIAVYRKDIPVINYTVEANITSFPAGVYLVIIGTEKKRTYKLIKQ
ncbi:ELWxxDGT repeat protein [Robertkochia flava]|uniref:ELWxxDGT repeat protein n=1 Tax=Robertkochia flava TaxID=3447986 RepID=UPI001CCEF2D3|nr:ELWxxDGT repeat protein [Robertkochia marina]